MMSMERQTAGGHAEARPINGVTVIWRDGAFVNCGSRLWIRLYWLADSARKNYRVAQGRKKTFLDFTLYVVQ